MKLSIAAFALAAAATSVQGSSFLRLNNKNADRSSNVLASEVILEGTVGEPTAEDTDFIGQALVASYNDIHWEVGHYLTGEHDVELVDPEGGIRCNLCPDDDSLAAAVDVFSIKTPVGGIRCNLCPDDDSFGDIDSLLTTAITEDCAGLCKKKAVFELEASFCNKIQSARGSKYLNSARSCSIRFDTEEAKQHRVNSKNSFDKVATIDSTLILKGVAGDATSKTDQAIIAKAFVSAYNDVHWDSNHQLTDVEIPFVAGTPDYPDGGIRCNLCPDDDSLAGAMTETMVLDVVAPVGGIRCNLCPDDDSMAGQFDMESLTTSNFNKKAVEVAFCKKLQNSNSDKLSATKSCSIAVETVIADSNKW